jgi:hypothetical protein
MRRRSVVLLSVGMSALLAGVTACGDELATPSGTFPPQCVEAQNPPKGFTGGTTDLGEPLPQGTIERPDVTIPVGELPTELRINDVRVGDGDEVQEGWEVTVNYVGVACLTGKPFDSSYEREPATFQLNQVIPGWSEGLVGMKVGGTRELVIPGDKAYTADNPPPPGSDISKFEPLFFVVELISARPAPEPEETPEAPEGGEAPPGTEPTEAETPGTTAAPAG